MLLWGAKSFWLLALPGGKGKALEENPGKGRKKSKEKG